MNSQFYFFIKTFRSGGGNSTVGHKKVSTGKESCSCCTKSFDQSPQLQGAKSSYWREIYSCSHCTKSFVHSSQLQRSQVQSTKSSYWREILQLFPLYKHVWSFISVTKISSARHEEFILARNLQLCCSHCTKSFDHSSQFQRSQLQRHEEFILARNPTVVLTVQSRLITHLIYRDLSCKGTKS
jgi:hypothetical protein